MKTNLVQFLLALLLCSAFNAVAQLPVLNDNFWRTDGSVHAIVHDEVNNLVYLGGQFSSVGPVHPNGSAFDIETAVADFNFETPNGTVFAAVEDGNGGWYIGGTFTKVGSESRNHLAQINAFGQVTAWTPNFNGAAADFNGSIVELLMVNEQLFVAGNFTGINGQERFHLASFNTTDGTLNPLKFNCNGPVLKLRENNGMVYAGGTFTAVGDFGSYGSPLDNSDGTPDLSFARPNKAVRVSVPDGNGGWYIGGDFRSVGGTLRNRLAHIDASGQLSPWNPNADGSVLSMVVSGSTIYVGGLFTSMGEESRNNLAAIDAVTGEVTAWNPNANGSVRSMVVSGSTIYVGGLFTFMDGQSRNRLAAVDAMTGEVTAWNPNSNGEVRAMAVSGSTVYVGGSFTAIAGQTRNRIAGIETGTGLPTAWNPGANGNVNALAISGNFLYVGGAFTNLGGQGGQGRFGAFDVSTGVLLSTPAANADSNPFSEVDAIAVSGTTVYIGGNFTTFGGQVRNHLAAYNQATGQTTPWNPNVIRIFNNGRVFSLTASESTVYAGGNFTAVGGADRGRLASFDAATGELSPWNPSASGPVESLAISESTSTVYVGGNFDNINGEPRLRIAAIDIETGIPTSWNPGANNFVRAITISESRIYAAGSFSQIGGQSRKIAAFDKETGDLTDWNPVLPPQSIKTLVVYDSHVYSGEFAGSRVVAINESTAQLKEWNPGISGGIEAIAFSDSTVYIGGWYTLVNKLPRRNIVALDATTGVATDWVPATLVNDNSFRTTVQALALSGSSLYVGGSFTSAAGLQRKNLAALDVNTGLPTPWRANCNNQVFAIAVYDNTVYIGGAFTKVKDVNRNRIAAVSASTGQLIASFGGANAEVNDLKVAGSTLYIAGAFGSIGGLNRPGLAALNLLSKQYTSWGPSNMTGRPQALAVTNTTVYIGGSFTAVGGSTRNRLAALNRNTGQLLAWNPNADGLVRSMDVFESAVYIGGNFNSIGGQSRNSYASVDANTGIPTAWAPTPIGHKFFTNIFAVAAFADKVVVGGRSGSRVFDITPCTINAICAPFTLTLSQLGTATLQIEDVNNGSSASCGAPALSLSQTHFNNAHLGENTVTLTVTDLAGNMETCTTTVTVLPNPCSANGGMLSAPANRSFCVGTGSPQFISVTASGASGTNQRWALIDNDGNIVETRAENSLFNLDNQAPGDYSIRYIRYEDDVTNLGSVTNIAQVGTLTGCYRVASNAINLFLRSEPDGGELSTVAATTICSNADSASRVQVQLTGNTGEFGRYAVIDLNDNDRIVSRQANGNINFNGLPAGDYRIHHIAFHPGVNLTSIEFADELQGCHNVSNGIDVTVEDCPAFALLTSHPNPTGGPSVATFTLPETGHATLEVYDMSGRLLRSLFNARAEAGVDYRFQFDGSHLPNGVYLYRLTTMGEVVVDKLMIAR